MRFLKQYFYKIKKHIYIIITALAVFQIIISYYTLKELSTENFTTYTKQVLYLQKQSDEQKNLNVSLVASAISADYTVNNILYTDYVDFNSLTEACSVIRKYMFFAQTISDIYIYSNKNDCLYTSHTSKLYREKNRSHDVWNCIDSFLSGGTKTYISQKDSSYYRVYRFDNASQNLIIIQESIPKIAEEYVNIQDSVHGKLIVVDGNFEIFFGSDKYNTGDTILNSELMNFCSGNESLCKIKQDKDSFYGISSYSADLKRYYILLTPTDIVIKYNMLGKNLIFAYLSMILSILLTFAIIYLLQRARKLFKSRNYQDILLPTDNTLSELVINHYKFSDKTNTTLSEYISQTDPNITEVAVVSIHFSGLEESSYSLADTVWIKQGINNILSEIFEPICSRILLSLDSDDTLEYIFCFKDSKMFVSGSLQKAKYCQEMLNNYINLNYSFCFSDVLPVKCVWDCYETMRKISEYLYVREENSILFSSDILKLSEEDFRYAEQLCDEIKKQMLVFEDYTGSSNTLNSLIGRSNPDQAHELAYKLAFNVLYVMTLFNEKGITHHTNADSFLYVSKIYNMDNVYDVLNYVKQLMVTIYGEFTVKEPDTERLIANCIEMINQNYSDPNFCANTVAEKMNFSLSYLTRKFKYSTGLSISNQITEVRLKAAADELATTTNKISDVMTHSGFVNNSHFSMLFKKKYNQTPSEYRIRSKNKIKKV